jgi:4-hydroxy-tetrahydrodipicolinate synthase
MSATLDLGGLSVALATPFQPDGSLDLPAFRRLVKHVAGGGADVLIALGTTGEASTILDEERDQVVAACLEEAGGKPVLVGAGSASTAQAALWTRRARALGANGALVVTPYYNRPTQAGLAAHYASIAQGAPGFPLVAYNVPGRTGVNLAPAGLSRVWEVAEVVAVKESSGNLGQLAEVARTLPAGKQLLAGDDHLGLPSIAVGAVGLVSVLGNVLPRETKALVEAARAGDVARARRLHQRLLPLMDALFVEPNPIAVKGALKLLGLCGDTLRLPLTAPEATTVQRLEVALAHARGALDEAPGAKP